MYQLRNLIHRTNVPNDPQNNMNAAEDFKLLLLHAHTILSCRPCHGFCMQLLVAVWWLSWQSLLYSLAAAASTITREER